jgi:hypothetical protein
MLPADQWDSLSSRHLVHQAVIHSQLLVVDREVGRPTRGALAVDGFKGARQAQRHAAIRPRPLLGVGTRTIGRGARVRFAGLRYLLDARSVAAHAMSSTASQGAEATAFGVTPANVITSRWRWDWSANPPSAATRAAL